MKFSSIHLAALAASVPVALAQDVCSQPTYYVTVTDRVTVTAGASAVDAAAETGGAAANCGLTYTVTTTQKHTVTVQAGAASSSLIGGQVMPELSNYHSVTKSSTKGGFAATSRYWNSTIAAPSVHPSGSGAVSQLPTFTLLPTTSAVAGSSSSSSSSSSSDDGEDSTVVMVSTATLIPVPVDTAAATASTTSAAAAATSAAVVDSGASADTGSSSDSSSSSGTALSSTLTGEATYYNPEGLGTCSFDGYTLPASVFGTALSSDNWDTAGNCGACVSVTGPSGNSITAMIVDKCPDCGPNHLDLYEPAFSELYDVSKGVIDVSWNIVPCPITKPLSVKNKEGTSYSWYSVQVRDHTVPVKSVEVSADNGSTWKATSRQDYNYFLVSGALGDSSVTSVSVKVTSITGKTVTVSGVSLDSSALTTASSNF